MPTRASVARASSRSRRASPRQPRRRPYAPMCTTSCTLQRIDPDRASRAAARIRCARRIDRRVPRSAGQPEHAAEQRRLARPVGPDDARGRIRRRPRGRRPARSRAVVAEGGALESQSPALSSHSFPTAACSARGSRPSSRSTCRCRADRRTCSGLSTPSTPVCSRFRHRVVVRPDRGQDHGALFALHRVDQLGDVIRRGRMPGLHSIDALRSESVRTRRDSRTPGGRRRPSCPFHALPIAPSARRPRPASCGILGALLVRGFDAGSTAHNRRACGRHVLPRARIEVHVRIALRVHVAFLRDTEPARRAPSTLRAVHEARLARLDLRVPQFSSSPGTIDVSSDSRSARTVALLNATRCDGFPVTRACSRGPCRAT
jgi:hypothetical protein